MAFFGCREKVSHFLKKFVAVYDSVEECLTALMLFTATMITCYAVLMRYVFTKPPLWSEEIVCYMQVWLTFLGISYVARDTTNFIRFDMVYTKIPERGRAILDIIVPVICMVLVGVVFFTSFKWVLQLKKYGGVSVILKIPNYIPRIIMPVSFLLLFLRLRLQLILAHLPPA